MLALDHVLNTVLPADVLHVVSGRHDVGAVMVSHADIAKIMFTDSTAADQDIIRSSADTVKRLTLELGGNDAGIVLPDADTKAIAEDLFWGAFINTGQTCAALKRLYVHEDIYEQVCQALIEIASAMPMGNGLDENNVLGPALPILKYSTIDQAVAMANGLDVGLGASVWSSDVDAARKVAARI